MRSLFVMVVLILPQFSSQIFDIPKQHVIQEFLSTESDTPLHKWMGCRYAKDRVVCELLFLSGDRQIKQITTLGYVFFFPSQYSGFLCWCATAMIMM